MVRVKRIRLRDVEQMSLNEKKKIGRPTLFNNLVAQKVIELYCDGKTDAQVSKLINVSEGTLENWKRKNQEFLWDTIEAKAMADEMVEAGLFQRAIGMNYYEEQVVDKTPVQVQKYAVPDVKAQQFWLKNRKPKRWKDRVELLHESTGKLFIESSNGKEDIDV